MTVELLQLHISFLSSHWAFKYCISVIAKLKVHCTVFRMLLYELGTYSQLEFNYVKLSRAVATSTSRL